MDLVPSTTAHLYQAFSQYSDNNAYVIGSTIELLWQTNYSTLSLGMWQDGNSSLQWLLQSQPAMSSFLWKVNLATLYSLSGGNVFYFQIFVDDGGSGVGFTSHFFNITDIDSVSDSTTASTSSASSTATTNISSTATSISSTASNPPSTATTESSPAASSSSKAQPTSSSGLSATGKVGVGVGVGVGVVALLVGTALGFCLSRRRSEGADSTRVDKRQPYHRHELPPDGVVEKDGQGYAYAANEMSAVQEPQELATDRTDRGAGTPG